VLWCHAATRGRYDALVVDPRQLAARFVSRAGAPAADDAALAPELARALDDAHRAWPAVELPDEDFIDHLAARVRPDDDLPAVMRQLKIADLYLACAAAHGRPGAEQAFEHSLLARVGQFVSSIDTSPAFVADVAQALRIKLLVGSDGQGKLAQYSGRGALDSWVCAVAIRTAIDLRRAGGHEASDNERALDVLAATDDPELELLRQRYDGQFRAALEAALTALEARDRTLLRLYFIEQLPAAQIGKLYRVHETTILRRISRVRESVFAQVRAALSTTLRLSASEFDELLALLRSRLDVSVHRLLVTQPGP
jgi:RNA polymerase sigma-70 factor (ECF subfamily)